MTDKIITYEGRAAHVSVGAILVNEKGQVLMMDRAKFPFGWACPAGHMDEEDESPALAVKREVNEESGINISKYPVFEVFSEYVEWNMCDRKFPGHYWHVFLVQVKGDEYVPAKSEVKEMKWVPRDEIGKLNLEKVWKHWFEKLKWI